MYSWRSTKRCWPSLPAGAHLIRSGIFNLVLSGFAVSGFVGAWGPREYDQRVLWLAAQVLRAIATDSFVRRQQRGPIDIPFADELG